MTRTIRFRITAAATIAVFLVLCGAGVALVAVNGRFLTENLDESLDQEIDALADQLERGELPVTLIGLGDDDTVAQVVVDGAVVAASASVTGREPFAPLPSTNGTTRRNVEALTSDTSEVRLVTRRAGGPDGPVVILIAGTVDDIHDSTRALTRTLLNATPPLVLLLGALIWWLVGRTLRPVEAIRAEVADIGGSDLHRRVPEPTSGDEIARLAHTMNDMLERLDLAAQRQDRFVADASHELRSPLTRIRSELEVDLAHPDQADPTRTHESILEEAIGLQRLVEDLLHLARRDADAPRSARRDPVDLDDIVLRLARRWRASDRVIDTTRVGPAQVLGDADALARAIGNLVDNAVRHASSSVSLACAEWDGHAIVTVTDDGPGIPEAERDRIFERFARVDDARTGATGGTGLGLAIARDIAEHHHGTLTVDSEHTPGASLVLTLPLV